MTPRDALTQAGLVSSGVFVGGTVSDALRALSEHYEAPTGTLYVDATAHGDLVTLSSPVLYVTPAIAAFGGMLLALKDDADLATLYAVRRPRAEGMALVEVYTLAGGGEAGAAAALAVLRSQRAA